MAHKKPAGLGSLETKDIVPTFEAKPSFDEKPDAQLAFDFSQKKTKTKKVKTEEESSSGRKGSAVDVMDLAGLESDKAVEKKKTKKKKAVKQDEDDDKEEQLVTPRSRGITKALVELTEKTTIVEDLHIADAWGTVSPRTRKISSPEAEAEAIRGSIVTGAVSPRLTTFTEDDDLAGNGADKFKDASAGWKGLLAHDDVEERVERIQRGGRRSSVPHTPKFLEKRSAKDEFEEVMENVQQYDKNGKPLPENIKRLLIEANMGWTESQFTLGYCYDTGSGGVEPNSQEAIQWYQEAAQAGHVTAQNNLGVLLATGHRNRIKPNHAEALKWYEKAANNGHPNAEFHLGLAFLKGDGVEKKNEGEAFIWFRNAAKQGHVLAQANIGAMYMSGQGVEQDFEKARKWCKKAASQGSAIAHHNLAVIYQRGYGVKPDDQMVKYHLKEALQGSNAGIITKQLSEDTLKAGNTLMNM